jgi:hypothetical protein
MTGPNTNLDIEREESVMRTAKNWLKTPNLRSSKFHQARKIHNCLTTERKHARVSL